MDIIFLIARIILGLFFFTHGLAHFTNKAGLVGYAQSRGMKAAPAMLVISGAAIMLGGLAIIFGIYMQFALAGLALFLVLVSLMTHNFWKDTDPMKRMQERTSFESNIALAAALVMVMTLVGF